MKVRFCNNNIIEYYNMDDHNTVFLEAGRKDKLQEILVMIKDSRKKVKMFYHLQYGLLDTPNDCIPEDSIGAFLTDLNEVNHYAQWEFLKYNANTQHYERLCQVVEGLDNVSDTHIVEYRK